jgi:GntR family transcriptional regulator
MKRRISSGQYNPGKQLFTGEELEREFQTSNITIRKAMEKLKNDGFVERRRGLGTTVSKIDLEPLGFELDNSFKKLKESIQRMKTQVKVLEITRTIPSEYIQNLLSMSPEQDLWRMKRIRTYKGAPVSYNTYYADPVYCADITYEDSKKEDIIDTVERASTIKINKVSQTLKSVVADLDLSNILGIPFGAPVFFNENTYHSASVKIIFLSQSYYRGDMFVFRTTSLL